MPIRQLQDAASRLLGRSDERPTRRRCSWTWRSRRPTPSTRPAPCVVTCGSPGSSSCPSNQQLAMCREATAVCQREEEKKLVLEILSGIRAQSLSLVLPFLAQADVKQEAGSEAVAIAEKVVRQNPAVVAKAMRSARRRRCRPDRPRQGAVGPGPGAFAKEIGVTGMSARRLAIAILAIVLASRIAAEDNIVVRRGHWRLRLCAGCQPVGQAGEGRSQTHRRPARLRAGAETVPGFGRERQPAGVCRPHPFDELAVDQSSGQWEELDSPRQELGPAIRRLHGRRLEERIVGPGRCRGQLPA